MSIDDGVKPVAMWRVVLAAILDFFTVFLIGGYLIGKLTGNLTSGGFNLEGGPALILFAVIFVYFVIRQRFLGGLVWQRILGAYRPRA